jgi:hypothetical protein
LEHSDNVPGLYISIVSDIIPEVRTGKIQPLNGLVVGSESNKAMCRGPVRANELGLEGDEHDPIFREETYKAIHLPHITVQATSPAG